MHKERSYNKREMSKRRPPIKPFVYGKYLIEYREEGSKLVRFHKEHIDTYKDAKKIKEKLLSEGVKSPVIKKIG
jgi:hypothetical protein|tara:strand:+ start:573 stop:794 length:222 start_codon:yes stop_codon:yes gene_type:complete